HIAGGGHDGMGVAHLQCQLLIQRWLTQRYPSLDVNLEITTADGRRRADVMAKSRSSGAQIAFEVQYASMSPGEWQARHDSYREMGIVDVWLWGYGGAHFHASKYSPGSMESNPTLAAVGAAELPILWIDPAFEHIGYTTREAHPFELPGVRVLSASGFGVLQSEPLSKFWIDTDRRFLTDHLADLLEEPTRVKKFFEQRRLAAEQQERRRQENHEGFYRRIRTKAEANARLWPSTAECRRITALFGLVPEFLKHVPTRGETIIHLPVPPVMWQGMLYLKYIRGRRDGWQLNVRALAQELESMDVDVRFPEEAVRSWLGVLEQYGHIARIPSSYRYDKWPKFEVRATVQQHRRESLAKDGAESDRREAAIAEFLGRPGPLLTTQELRGRGLPIHAERKTPSGKAACVHCSAALGSSMDKALGYHGHCAPALSRVLNHPLRG
ncbi:MAG: competence protein CoiA family protein, partial [Burkholderiales bacterium]